ncbi:MAG: DUF4199 domain-containing protein [Thermoanaerobaculia bacterium]
MKKTVLSFGLISGAVSIAIMAATVPFIYSGRYELSDVLGYSSIVLSALIVFFGIRSYRQQAAGERITFGRGMAVGVLITLVSCVCYAAAFEILYFKLYPDFGDKFSACLVDRARARGAGQQEIAETASKAQTFKRLYDNPATNAMVTFATSFPIGLAVTAVSAAILRKR